MVDNASEIQTNGKHFKRLTQLVGELKSAFSRKERPSTNKKESPAPPTKPAGPEFHYHSRLESEAYAEKNERRKIEMEMVAKATIQAHKEIMANRRVELLRSAGGGLALMAPIKAADFEAFLEQNPDSQKKISPEDLKRLKEALYENETDWETGDVFVTYGASSPHLLELEIVERTGEEDDRLERSVYYWVRNVTDHPSMYADNRATRVPHDYQLNWSNFEPILIGRKFDPDNKEVTEEILKWEKQLREEGMSTAQLALANRLRYAKIPFEQIGYFRNIQDGAEALKDEATNKDPVKTFLEKSRFVDIRGIELTSILHPQTVTSKPEKR